MATKQNQQKIRLLIGMVILGAIALGVYHARARRQARHGAHHFAKVQHLQDGGYCYQDGWNWWYYDTVFTDSGGVYSPKANAWVESAKSPAENNLRINAASDASDPEEVEISSQGQPEPAVVSAAEVTELNGQISDMVNEGNPNSQDMADTDAGGGAMDGGGSGGDGGGDSGGGDGGGGGD